MQATPSLQRTAALREAKSYIRRDCKTNKCERFV